MADKEISRRGFLKGAGLSVAATGLMQAGDALAKEATHPLVLGPGAAPVTLTVNGRAHALQLEPRTTLAEALRVSLGLTGTKVVCDRGSCSACTVHLDGTPVLACMTLAVDVGAGHVTTIEGLATGGTLHPVQEQFIAHDAMQCGFCTPGMIMSCAALLGRNRHPSLDDVKGAVSGNLCRCGTYANVFTATLAAAGEPLPRHHQAEMGQGEVDLAAQQTPPAGAPPPWPKNGALVVVGKPARRLEGRLKVTGAARYTADVQLPGMLYARRVASPFAHARVRSVDVSAARRLPGVRAVHVVERNREGAQLRQPAAGERYPRVRYVGQTVAGVAAESQAIADEAARLVLVDYEPLPCTVDLEEARRDGAPLVFAGPTEQAGTGGGGGGAAGVPQRGNVRGPLVETRGDADAGLRAAAVTVAGEFATQVQTHSALETHGVVADWRPDGLTIYASTQATYSVRNELAEVFDLPKSKVRVVTEHMGGGFGAKFGAGTYGVLATHLSKAAGAPVRLMLDRKEEHLAAGCRPSSWQRLELGASKSGELGAVKVVSHGSGGVSLGAGVGVVAAELYPCANFRGEHSDVFTHAGPAAAMRAPGAPQGVFAMEQLVDELAEKLRLDPLALRDRLDRGDEPDRQARRLERQLGAARFGWSRRRAPRSDSGVVKRGLGVAQSIWFRGSNPAAACEVRLLRDGSVEFLSSVQDIGTGTRTALAQVVAEELGVHVDDVTMKIGDTSYPIGPGSGGSGTLISLTPAARVAAWQVKQKLFNLVAPQLGARAADLEARDRRVFVRAEPRRGLTLRKAAAAMRGEQLAAQTSRGRDYGAPFEGRLGGVQFAEVAVDTETGVIRVERVVAVHDCGRPLNPLGLHSQITGGVQQGISWALYEERHLDRPSGRMVNANLDQYKIAGAREAPVIEVLFIDQYLGRSATDVHGVGEPANIATAAAVANAVYNAIGVRLHALPMNPAAVLAALGRARSGGRT